jgi:hypothetical protein
MNVWRDKLPRIFIAGTVFWMALVLTPRAWVDDVRTQESAEIPVRLLDQPDDCLWCEPYPALEPVNCTDEEQQKPVWLNPDELSQPETAPCLNRKSDDKPSA